MKTAPEPWPLPHSTEPTAAQTQIEGGWCRGPQRARLWPFYHPLATQVPTQHHSSPAPQCAFIEYLLHTEHEWALWQEGELSLSVCGHLGLQVQEKRNPSLKAEDPWMGGGLPEFVAVGFFPPILL